MAKPVTRGELREELAKHPTREEFRTTLREELAKYATKQDLETWGHALYDKIDRVKVELRTELGTEIREQIAHFVKAVEESTRKWFTAFDDKYKDLPERVAKLEARND